MSSRAVIYEQGDSLAAMFQEAGHEHGDVSEVELAGVGVTGSRSQIHLKFCPASIEQHRLVSHGPKAERQLPVPTTLRFSGRAKQQLGQAFRKFHGFATIRCRVRSNGVLHLTRLQIIKREPCIGINRSRQAYAEFTATMT